jgi:myo-inositol-1(or 4)-monophosphatase
MDSAAWPGLQLRRQFATVQPLAKGVPVHPYHAVALSAARAAGRVICRGFKNLTVGDIRVKGRNDFVTRVDLEAEVAIKKVISRSFPRHRILAEETGYSATAGEFLWVIDPLDGTTNFIHGIPHFAVSLALLKKGRVFFALIYDPLSGDRFHASAGRGAFLNGRPIAVGREKRLAAALGATGFPFKAPGLIMPYTTTFRSLISKCEDMRRCGSAALDLAYTACGRYDFFWEAYLRPWDFMAGKLLIAEAGGTSSDFSGKELAVQTSSVLAANSNLHAVLLKEIGNYFKGTSTI